MSQDALRSSGRSRALAISVAVLSAASLVGGCGLQVPDIGSAAGPAVDQMMTEIDLINHIKCELHLGAREALRVHGAKPWSESRGVARLRGLEAKLSLKLTVDDTTSLNPGISITNPMENVISHFSTGPVTSPQSFSTTFGLQASAQSTRIRAKIVSDARDQLRGA